MEGIRLLFLSYLNKRNPLVRLLLWNPTLSQLVKNFQAICKIQIFVIVYTRIRLYHPITNIPTPPIPLQPPVGQVLLIIEASRLPSDTPHHIRSSLEEWSARRTDLYLITHKSHKIQTSMSQVEFEPATSASERPQSHALDRAATGMGCI
jgi:hypothetical protein